MRRTRRTVSVAAAVAQRPNHRPKIETTDSQFARQFVSQDFSAASQGQKKCIKSMFLNELSQVLFDQVQTRIKIPAVIAYLVIKKLCPFGPIIPRRLFELRGL